MRFSRAMYSAADPFETFGGLVGGHLRQVCCCCCYCCLRAGNLCLEAWLFAQSKSLGRDTGRVRLGDPRLSLSFSSSPHPCPPSADLHVSKVSKPLDSMLFRAAPSLLCLEQQCCIRNASRSAQETRSAGRCQLKTPLSSSREYAGRRVCN